MLNRAVAETLGDRGDGVLVARGPGQVLAFIDAAVKSMHTAGR